MRNKGKPWDGEAAEPHGRRLIDRIRSDLERMGVAPPFSKIAAVRLEPAVAKLSPQEYEVALSSVATAYCIDREGPGSQGIAPEDMADVQRLMQGFSEEVQKLDEGLRMLSAYVTRLRKRSGQAPLQTLH